MTEPQLQKRGDWKQNIYIENGTDRVLLQEVNTDDDGWPTDTLKSSQIWPGQQVVHSVAPYPSRGTVLTVIYSMFDDPEKKQGTIVITMKDLVAKSNQFYCKSYMKGYTCEAIVSRETSSDYQGAVYIRQAANSN